MKSPRKQSQRTTRRRAPQIDALEARRLLADDFAYGFVNIGGALGYQIVGTDANDTIEVGQMGGSYAYKAFQTDDPEGGPTAEDVLTPGAIAFAKSVMGIPASSPFKGFFVTGEGGDDAIVASADLFDELFAASDLKTSLTADGGAGNDTIVGGRMKDALTGGDGDDILIGRGGADALDGGAGLDTVTADALDTSVKGGTGGEFVDEFGVVAGDTVDFSGSAGGVHYANTDFEYVFGSSKADTIDNTGYAGTVPVEIHGNAGNDTLTGGAADETIDGGAGNDTILGGKGVDVLTGGAGVDTLSYADSDAGVNADLALNSAAGGTADNDTIGGFENLTGSQFDDNLSGNAAANVLDGGAGNDTLSGQAGNDRLLGGDGHDDLVGGAGNDFLEGGAGVDTVTGGSGNDTIAQSFADVASYLATGTLNGDMIYGQSGADTFLFLDAPKTGVTPTTAEVIDAANKVNSYLKAMDFANATDYIASVDTIDLTFQQVVE